ncbi:CGNR zinc finger domain-containing protein [Kitasatospora viridis]|uniref:CGNR zinc finger protein n=1 Tax=Kitasatospora viridis TaxID=281105 RepID=A0A561UGM6_9ACTN|nr:CGNR zinc finger domain-containing protein [Kitasatospora viridis]TWF98518.1 CGNR zinc finger protein [Kitasatospora viridis]
METTQTEPPAVELANTVVAVRGRERDELDGWLAAHGLAADAERFRELRDAVRRLLAAATGDGAYPAADLAVLNAAAALAPRWPVLLTGPDGTPTTGERSAAGPADAALADRARDAVRLLGTPARADLRACQGPGCVQYFVRDHPRREWCGPGCGNRARAARHYRKKREG